MRTAQITYDVTTPESAEHGGLAELGFYAPGGWKFPEPGCHDGPSSDHDLTTREALQWALGRCAWWDNGDGTWYDQDRDENYATGESTGYALHVEGVTPASLGRIARLLGASS